MRFWNNLGLTWKMSIFVVSMLLVIGVLSGRFFLTIGHLSDEARDVKDQGAIGALMLAREIDHLNWIGALQRYVLDPKQTTLQLQADPHKCGLGQWYYGAGRKDAVTKFPQLEAELAKLEASHTALHESAVQVRQLKEKGDGAGALRVFNEVSTPSVQTVQAGLKKVTAMMDQAQAATIQEFEYNVAASQKLAIAGNVIGVVLALLMGILIAKTVASPMEKLAKAATLIANGDLNVDIAMKRTDEIGSLASAMQRVSAVLQSILGEYQTLEKRVEGGDLDAKADAAAYQGGFATLISGTNAILGRFLYILEHLPTPVVLLCKDLKISYLNAVGRDVSGAGFMGKTCKQVMARDDSDTPDDALQKAVTTLRPATGETRAHPQGKDLDIRYTVIPILTQEGKLACVLQLITDLTAIKQTQRTIANVADQAATIANRVAAASEELSAQVAQVTAGTELERDRMDSTASAMTEMNATVLEVARSAGQASEQSEATRSKASDGAELVDRVVRSINLVNKVAATLQTNMQELG
ncbi:MAG: CZB domain-containing protein, partial [Deltaproteobacteria bacterium]|nr:CZB domain-containing protein [Deltaproteobacteria bacterium]